MSESTEPVFKLIVIGDSGSGKSCLSRRYTKDQYMDDYNVTLGVDYQSKTVKIDANIKVKLQIWDTAGQEAFRSLIKSFYIKAAAVVLVYDLTRRKTFESLDGWLEEARNNTQENAMFILIGTHLDLHQDREVEKLQAEEWIKQNDVCMFFETSAKTSENVQRAFDQICKQLFLAKIQKKQSLKEIKEQDNSVSLNQNKAEGEESCC